MHCRQRHQKQLRRTATYMVQCVQESNAVTQFRSEATYSHTRHAVGSLFRDFAPATRYTYTPHHAPQRLEPTQHSLRIRSRVGTCIEAKACATRQRQGTRDVQAYVSQLDTQVV